jgi:hypothetical protein
LDLDASGRRIDIAKRDQRDDSEQIQPGQQDESQFDQAEDPAAGC